MTPGRYDLKLYRGDSYAIRFTLWEDAAATIPVDLTGAVAKAEIRNESGGTIYASPGVALSGLNIIDLTLSALQCQACPTKGVWDLQLTFPDTSVRTPLAGLVITFPDVTDSVAAPALARR